MDEFDNGRGNRHQLVTAAHDFLLAVLPFRHSDSIRALAQFTAGVADTKTTVSETEVILLDVLTVLNGDARCPNLLDQFVARRRYRPDPIARFCECAGELIKNRAIGNKHVQRALAIIETRYREDTLTQAKAAGLVGLSASDLSTRFSQHTGIAFTECLRDTRLDAAATLLLSTERRVKEIWVSVGYNDASNFDHQFKHRYGLSPTDYSRRAIGPNQVAASVPDPAPVTASTPVSTAGTVLIVEDHENTRETVGRYLRHAGYDVVLSATGDEGLSAASLIAPRSVMLDYQLPDMSGLEWLRVLRQRAHESRAGVVVFTADWDVAEHTREIESLGARLVSKRCDIDELVQCIASCSRPSSISSVAQLSKEQN